MAEIYDFVVLEMTKDLQKKTKSSHAAFKSDNLRNIQHKRGKVASKFWACVIKKLGMSKAKGRKDG